MMRQALLNSLKGDSLSPEAWVIVLGARLRLGQKEADHLEGLLKAADLSWPKILAYAHHFRIQPLLYTHLAKESFSSLVPQAAIDSLKKEYHRQAIRNLSLYSQLQHLLTILAEEKIRLILLKGIYLAKWVYEDIALRPMSDMDLLCHKEDQKRLSKILESLGYRQEPDDRGRSPHLPPFFHPKALARLEIHTDLAYGRQLTSEEMDRVFARSLSTEFHSLPVSFLAPEDNFLFLASHLLQHLRNGGVAMYWLADLHELVNQKQDLINWNLIGERINFLKLSPQLAPIFELLRTYWPTPIPEKIVRTQNHAAPYFHLSFHLSSLFLPSYQRRILMLSTFPTWKDRLCALWRLIFPPKASLLRNFHPRHPSFIYFYYLHRPFLLAQKIRVGPKTDTLWWPLMKYTSIRNGKTS